jgi:hypothetical protein
MIQTTGKRRLLAMMSKALLAWLAEQNFWCEKCGRTHPLSEHRACRGDDPKED